MGAEQQFCRKEVSAMKQMWTVVTVHFVEAANMPEAKEQVRREMADWCSARPATNDDLQVREQMLTPPEQRTRKVAKFVLNLKPWEETRG
jgi:hypothetical protein